MPSLDTLSFVLTTIRQVGQRKKAELLGLDIPDPISIRQLRNENIGTQMRDKVLVDDVQMIIGPAIAEHLGVKEVVAATFTPFGYMHSVLFKE